MSYYKYWTDYEVAGKDDDRSITLLSYEDGTYALDAFQSTEYGKEHSVTIPLKDKQEVLNLISGLQKIVQEMN